MNGPPDLSAVEFDPGEQPPHWALQPRSDDGRFTEHATDPITGHTIVWDEGG